MESELQCPVCLRQFAQPVLLPCSHPVCFGCARSLAKSCGDDEDLSSVYSEADSGVACGSRPGSCLDSPSSTSVSVTCVTCGVCSALGERGLDALRPCLLLERLLPLFGRPRGPVTCQLCERDARPASVLCQQCQVYYCPSCQQRCHPARGPLATHSLLPAGGDVEPPGRGRRPDPLQEELRTCWRHPAADSDLFCVDCDLVTCQVCRAAGPADGAATETHDTHRLVPLADAVKSQKTALSQTLQSLSERAKSATELIHRLRKTPEAVTETCAALEAAITAQCDALAAMLAQRRQRLLDHVNQERQRRASAAREQVASWTGQIQRTTALLRFCIETLKEPNQVAFLQMGGKLQARADSVLQSLQEELRSLEADESPVQSLELTLDTSAVEAAVKRLSFTQMKPPSAPEIVHEECCSENNSVVISWRADVASFVEGHVLELDDGSGGEFVEVYCGPQTVCTIDGLHFNSVYQARVRSFNGTGPGAYSQPIRLQTAPVAWFALDPEASHHQLRLSDSCQTASCDSFEPQLALGDTGFSRGVHYWEWALERYDGNGDPAFGVARIEAGRAQMLGADEHGWSMYIDEQRSWFMHAGAHERRVEGGISTGSVVGVLLDLRRGHLSFFVDGQPHGPIAFTGLSGTFYPAVSLSRNCKVRLRTALEPPSESSGTDSDNC